MRIQAPERLDMRAALRVLPDTFRIMLVQPEREDNGQLWLAAGPGVPVVPP